MPARMLGSYYTSRRRATPVRVNVVAALVS
jgi:hypothetical protein